MANLTARFLSAVAEPTGVWEKIIMAFHSGIPNYAWAIIVFTVVLKLILLPLDFLNKYITAKNTKVQNLIQPELAKIQKQYGNNKQILNQKTMELYKKHNYNVTGSCVIMLVNMALTLFIFITLFSGLNSMAAYKVQYQYNEVQKSYYAVSDYNIDNIVDIYENHYNIYVNDANNLDQNGAYNKENAANYAKTNTINTIKSYKNEISDADALKRYNEVKESWLWVDNIWKSDTPWTNSVANFDEYLSNAGANFKDTEIEVKGAKETLSADTLKELAKVEYEQIMNPISESAGRENGYLVIVILAVGATVVSMLATQGKLKFKRKKKTTLEEDAAPKQKQPGGWLMLVLLPGIMLWITLSYNAVFGLYILMSSVVGIATTPLVNWGIKLMENRKSKKAEKTTVSYSRKK